MPDHLDDPEVMVKLLDALGLGPKDPSEPPAASPLPLLLAPVLAIIASGALGLGLPASIVLTVVVAVVTGVAYAFWLLRRDRSSPR